MENHYRHLERLYLSAPTNRYYAPAIRIAEGRAEIDIPLREEFFHGMGAVHGSVYFKALDDAAYFAVNSLVSDVMVLTVSFNIYFTRPISTGVLRASGRVVHASRRLWIAESQAAGDDGRVIATGSGTFMRSEIGIPEAL
jgi:uncharacterized protein (TIGR00369 family)